MLAAGALILSVIALITGGGARDAVPVLWVVLAGAGAIDLVLSYTSRAEVTVDFAPEVFVGETFSVTVSLAQYRPGLRAKFDWPKGISGPDVVTFDQNDDGVARALVSCRAIRRGAWPLRHLWLLWTSRLGLFECVPRVAVCVPLRVVPNIRLVQSGQITTTVTSMLYGVKENRSIGEGSEFHQLRDFTPGMDIKTIDWKRSAKRRSLIAKELHAERNHHVIIALDNGYLMREEIAGLPKIDHAITAALATAWAAAIGGDLVGHYSYDVRPRSFGAPEPGRKAFARLRSWTSDLEYVGRESNHTLALSDLNARTPKRSLIIIFSDFVDTTSAEILSENIALLSKRHVVVFVTIRDPETESMIIKAPKDLDGMAALVSASQAVTERRLVFEKLARLGVTVLDARPGEVTSQLVSTYLDIKARELI